MNTDLPLQESAGQNGFRCSQCGTTTKGPNNCRQCGHLLSDQSQLESSSTDLGVRIRNAIRRYKQGDEKMLPNSQNLRIGVWGPHSAGKTTYIITVWGACLAREARWSVRLDDAQTSEFIIERLTLLRNGEFPEPTIPQPEPLHYSYLFSPRTSNKKSNKFGSDKSPLEAFRNWIASSDVTTPTKVVGNGLIVSFTDVAGDQYFKDPLDSPLWDDIWSCDGILCLLDPSNPLEHFQMTLKLGQNLWLKSKGSNRLIGNSLPHYIALCFSKIDQSEFYPYRDKPNELNAKLDNETGMDTHAMLSNFFLPERINVFCMSAIGVDDHEQSLVRDGRIENPHRIRPINIISPLRWLFESLQSKPK